MSDLKTLTMRDLNRKTASVLDALERGETFELHRNGKVGQWGNGVASK